MSFGLSRGRTLDTAGYGILHSELPPYDQGRFDPRDFFDNPANPFEIEIGSGKGTFLVKQAPLQPEVNYLGIEYAAEFYRYSADRVRRHSLNNVKILHTNATEFMRFWCADQIACVIHLYFSDPWPKKRHHKRRVIQDQSLIEFHRILQLNGELRIVTDHTDLWEWYQDHANRHQHLFDRSEFDRPESADEGEIVGTNFERKYAKQGRPFYAMTLVRRH